MLHIAPEQCIESRLDLLLSKGYVTLDLMAKNVDVKADVTNMPFADSSIDMIYCSHVLEHIQNDKKAIGELFRVLSNSGWALVLVPITADKTFEDPTITAPRDRIRIFGQRDHVRRYGPDFVDRLREVGFTVNVIKVTDIFGEDEARYFGIANRSGEIYHCEKV